MQCNAGGSGGVRRAGGGGGGGGGGGTGAFFSNCVQYKTITKWLLNFYNILKLYGS